MAIFLLSIPLTEYKSSQDYWITREQLVSNVQHLLCLYKQYLRYTYQINSWCKFLLFHINFHPQSTLDNCELRAGVPLSFFTMLNRSSSSSSTPQSMVEHRQSLGIAPSSSRPTPGPWMSPAPQSIDGQCHALHIRKASTHASTCPGFEHITTSGSSLLWLS